MSRPSRHRVAVIRVLVRLESENKFSSSVKLFEHDSSGASVAVQLLTNSPWRTEQSIQLSGISEARIIYPAEPFIQTTGSSQNGSGSDRDQPSENALCVLKSKHIHHESTRVMACAILSRIHQR